MISEHFPEFLCMYCFNLIEMTYVKEISTFRCVQNVTKNATTLV